MSDSVQLPPRPDNVPLLRPSCETGVNGENELAMRDDLAHDLRVSSESDLETLPDVEYGGQEGQEQAA